MIECNCDLRCNFCRLLRKRFMGKQVALTLDCGVNQLIVIRGFVQPYSFEDDNIKLFGQSSGGNVTATACCDDIYLIDYQVDEPVTMVSNSPTVENMSISDNYDTCDFCSGILNEFLGRQVTFVLRGDKSGTIGALLDIYGDFVEVRVTQVRRNIICCRDICAVIAPV